MNEYIIIFKILWWIILIYGIIEFYVIEKLFKINLNKYSKIVLSILNIIIFAIIILWQATIFDSIFLNHYFNLFWFNFRKIYFNNIIYPILFFLPLLELFIIKWVKKYKYISFITILVKYMVIILFIISLYYTNNYY